MRLSTITVLLATLVCALACVDDANAQEVRKAIRDYSTDRVFNYSPDDPTYRGKLFNIHTGHYGKYYNCDGEESKRNSPYICWKPHTERDLPPHVGIWETIKRDLNEVRHRVRDGSCTVNCECSQCQIERGSIHRPGCTDCAQNFAHSQAKISPPSQALPIKYSSPKRWLGTQEHATHSHTKARSVPQTCSVPKSGLVQGSIIGPSSLHHSESSVQTAQNSQPTARVSGLLNQNRLSVSR